jgi:F0F1-type ATP synthase delta subunit
MKYPASTYAKALAEVIVATKEADNARVIKNFLAMVERNGDSASLGKILEQAGRFAREENGIRKVAFESARPLTKSQKSAVSGLAKKGDVIEERIDPSLIAGVKVIVNDELQLDGSLKGKLDTLFGNT